MEPEKKECPYPTQATDKRDWSDVLYRLEIPAMRKFVATTLADHSNKDGSSIFPGEERLARMTGLHVVTVRGHLKALRKLGMLTRTEHNRGRTGFADVYRLTIPAGYAGLQFALDPDMNKIGEAGDGYPALLSVEDLRALRLGGDDEYRAVGLGGDTDPALWTTAEPPSPGALWIEEPPSPTTLWMTEPPSPTDRTTEPYDSDTNHDQPKSQNRSWSPYVGTSLEPETIKDVEPSTPVIVRASAAIVPTPAAADAIAILIGLPNDGEWFRAAATRVLRSELRRDPSTEEIAVRAIAIAARTDTETRSA